MARWSGDGTKTTEVFQVDAAEWRVVISAQTIVPSDVHWVWVHMYQHDGSGIGSASVNDDGSDTTYVHNRKGRFYFDIQPGNMDWEVAVQTPRLPAERVAP